MYTLLKCLAAGLIILSLFWVALVIWEFLVRFYWKNPDLSILFDHDEW